MKKLISLITLMLVALCFVSCDKDSNSGNPFVGNWKCGNTRYEFTSNGYFTARNNYYENRENLFVSTGTYSYNAQQQTLAMQYDSGTSRICIVQTCTYDKIVYFDPKDLYTWTLIRE